MGRMNYANIIAWDKYKKRVRVFALTFFCFIKIDEDIKIFSNYILKMFFHDNTSYIYKRIFF